MRPTNVKCTDRRFICSATAAATATVVDRTAATVAAATRFAAAVVVEQQDDTDDEQDPRPGAVVTAEDIGQTHNKFLLCSLPVGEDYTTYYVDGGNVVTEMCADESVHIFVKENLQI